MIRDDETDVEELDEINNDAGEDDSSDEATEARARKNGWIPESEWDSTRAAREGKKKPARFMSAKEFLDRVDNELPLMRERNRKLEREVTNLSGKLGEMGSVVKETRDLLFQQHEMTKKSNLAAYNRGIEDQKRAMRKAVEEGDTQAFDAAEKKMGELQEKKDELNNAGAGDDDDADTTRQGGEDERPGKGNGAAKPAARPVDPATKAWLNDPDNKWFHTDPALNGHMIKMNGVVRQEHPDWSVEKQLAEAERRTRAKFPEEFGENPNRGGNGAVARPNSEERGKKGKNSFESIPPEDQKTFYRLEKQFKAAGKVITKAEYAEEYFNQ